MIDEVRFESEWESGFKEGYNKGYNKGYSKGFRDGAKTIATAVNYCLRCSIKLPLGDNYYCTNINCPYQGRSNCKIENK